MLQVEVAGTWQAASTGRELFSRSLSDPSRRWLANPSFGQNAVKTSTRKSAPTTLGFRDLSAHSINGSRGTLRAHLRCNPTRTLASLLDRFGETENFQSYIIALPHEEFFASSLRTELESLDGNDNYLPSPSLARAHFGNEVFSSFIPIYISKLQRAVMAALAENIDVSVEGTDVVWSADGDEIRLNWGSAKVPQLESYFERYHSRAIEAVRTAGLSLITRDNRAALQRFASRLSMEREADCFSVSMELPSSKRLVIYAKTARRIRFEVRRVGRGRYSSLDRPVAPADRISAIITQAREDAARACRWPIVGEQFAEPDLPSVGDLIELIGRVVVATSAEPQTTKELLARLLTDGGISAERVSGLSHGLAERLERAGVVERTSVRRRGLTGSSHRLALTPLFEQVRSRLLEVLPSSEAEDH